MITNLETACDIQTEIEQCMEEYPDEARFVRWHSFMEEVINALKGGVQHGCNT